MNRPSNWTASRGAPTVVAKIQPKPGGQLGEEYGFLRTNARARTKYTMAAPSYHRRYWSDAVSPQSGYARCEDYLRDVRDWLHAAAAWLVDRGCTYIQLDAPNYGSLCDPDNRAWHKDQGHDLVAEVVFDAALDSSVFNGLDVTSALHVCRGNGPGGHWHSKGGYSAIEAQLFPNLTVDVVLLEYDSDRAGDFAPIQLIPSGATIVLGLLSTKSGGLEDAPAIEARIEEAARVRPLDSLALSTQCGFASAANAPMSVDQQRAKLERVVEVAQRVWG
jgi:methionine synthase II (cobalamin-independent)